jgi:hypothetical protein
MAESFGFRKHRDESERMDYLSALTPEEKSMVKSAVLFFFSALDHLCEEYVEKQPLLETEDEQDQKYDQLIEYMCDLIDEKLNEEGEEDQNQNHDLPDES